MHYKRYSYSGVLHHTAFSMCTKCMDAFDDDIYKTDSPLPHWPGCNVPTHGKSNLSGHRQNGFKSPPHANAKPVTTVGARRNQIASRQPNILREKDSEL